MPLADLMARSLARSPESPAVRSPGRSVSYGELDALANQLARALRAAGVAPGDRVGIWLEKAAEGIAVMQAALRVGAVYVPIDPFSPPARARKIIDDCAMRALVTTGARATSFGAEGVPPQLSLILVDGGEGVAGATPWGEVRGLSPLPLDPHPAGDDELAYILYTSGSTGTPKGVCISHKNALAFVEWAAEIIAASPTDSFANHAPFHFDLSVLDIYVAFLAGAAVVIIPEGVAYSAPGLVEFVAKERPTVWYSVPSALMMMMDHGGFLDLPELPMRVVFFAGEPFPIAHLRRLYERWPSVRMMNLYGPTETNVCTYYELTESLDGRTRPVPIGRACSGDEVWAEKEDGSRAGVGEEGELLCSGPTVMLGYWGKPRHGAGPYRTGDLVKLEENGDYLYIGRRDHMVKVHGHRVELGEIESALLEHEALREAAVVVHTAGATSRLIAFVSLKDASAPPPGLLAMKKHCADRLPRYMIVDRVRCLEALPRTGNGKIDRRKLTEMLESG